jgi:hypothetical protein
MGCKEVIKMHLYRMMNSLQGEHQKGAKKGTKEPQMGRKGATRGQQRAAIGAQRSRA